MNIVRQITVLQAYSRGEIGWRSAVDQLELTHFSDLQALMEKHGLAQFEPGMAEQSASAQKLATLFSNHVEQDSDRES